MALVVDPAAALVTAMVIFLGWSNPHSINLGNETPCEVALSYWSAMVEGVGVGTSGGRSHRVAKVGCILGGERRPLRNRHKLDTD